MRWLDEHKYDDQSLLYGLVLDISYQLKELMTEKGIDKYQLADMTGMSVHYINKILNGDVTSLSLKTLAKILSALKVNAGIKIIDRDSQ